MEEENNGDVAEDIFKEMEESKNKPKEEVKVMAEVEVKVDCAYNPVGKDKKELRTMLKENAKIKADMSAKIKEMIKKRAELTEFNLKLRAELAKKE